MTDAHPLNSGSMRLHLILLLQWKFPDLDSSWPTFLTNTSEERLSVAHNLDLGELLFTVDVLFLS